MGSLAVLRPISKDVEIVNAESRVLQGIERQLEQSVLTSFGLPDMSIHIVYLMSRGIEGPHYHKHHKEILLCASGFGELMLGDDRFNFNEGVCIVATAGTIHSVRSDSGRLVIIRQSFPAYDPSDVYYLSKEGVQKRVAHKPEKQG